MFKTNGLKYLCALIRPYKTTHVFMVTQPYLNFVKFVFDALRLGQQLWSCSPNFTFFPGQA